MEALHVKTYLLPTDTSFCAVGEGVDCDAVALSPWSVILGIPVPIWGVVGFGAMLYAALWRREVLWPLALAGAVASVSLLGISVFLIGSICLLCEGAHVLALLIAGLAFVDRDPPGLRLYLQSRREVLADAALPAGILLAAWLFVPPYWAHASWQGGPPYPTGVDEYERPWIGAEEPELTVHEYVDYGCPHCAVATGITRMHLGRKASKLRIVRHHQPRQDCVPRNERLCKFARVAVCAGDQGKFWEMDDWLFAHRVFADFDLDRAIEEVGVDGAALRACIETDAAFERLQVDVDEAKAYEIRGTPGYVVDGRKVGLPEVIELVGEL